MPELSRAKAAQFLVTGILLVLLSSGLFGLLYVIHGKSYEFGGSDIFDQKTAFWVGIPIIVTGLVGVLTGITKKNALVTLYMLSTLISTGLAGLVSIGYGLKVTKIRGSCGDDNSCRNSDTAVLIGTIVLIASLLLSISIWAAVKTCQAKWGPSKKTASRLSVTQIQYTRQVANGQAATGAKPTAPTAPTNNVANGHTCFTCGGLVNTAIQLPVAPPVQPNNPPSVHNSRYESLDDTAKTIHVYQSLQSGSAAKDDGPNSAVKDDGPNSAAKDDGPNSAEKDDSPNSAEKDDGSVEKGNEAQDLNTTTSTYADYEIIDKDVQAKVNEAYSDADELSTAL